MSNKTDIESLPHIQQLFIKNTIELLSQQRIDKSRLAERLAMSRTLVYKYLSGKTMPSIGVVDRFAKALNTTTSSLLSETREAIEYNRIENEKLNLENQMYNSYFVESRKDLYKLINKVPEEDAIVFRIEFYNLLVKYIGQRVPEPSQQKPTDPTLDLPSGPNTLG